MDPTQLVAITILQINLIFIIPTPLVNVGGVIPSLRFNGYALSFILSSFVFIFVTREGFLGCLWNRIYKII